ncbi:putative chitin biosynthesis protein (Chs5) [Aspergillus candidus]|uniref:Chitin biosynthesis protein n=1 Tax=Aspergillus candidus TaxID=41067 RepID=A0A2I2FED7_ASPCN|nr:hypothetical protein BDW47DRAFT_104059 [Aspergillus candidus]PLB38988.1 hypothetical protein BDW47DRAFT_104059 [Aspergillus candidus]
MLVSLTVGKVDAGVAVLLTQDNRLIEFPSVLLPSNITSGSIVDITVARNHAAEVANATAFQSLQKRILNTYGVKTPSPPVLRLRNATQTSLVLEWDPVDLATASLKSLSLYRNGSKAGSIPRPLETRSTKISGLAIHTEYSFHLVLRTTAGTYQSEKLTCRTHKMTDLSGITVTAGVLPPPQKEALASALDRIGGRLIDSVRIDTTHFVCTEGRGPLWEKAVEMNIPVVVPEWVDACESEGTIVSVRGYYLNADPKTRQLGPIQGSTQHQRTISSATSAHRHTPSSPSVQLPVSSDGRRPTLSQDRTRQESNTPGDPPITPFPGQHMSGQPTAEESEVASADEDDESPPPPPPKDETSLEQNGHAESVDQKETNGHPEEEAKEEEEEEEKEQEEEKEPEEEKEEADEKKQEKGEETKAPEPEKLKKVENPSAEDSSSASDGKKSDFNEVPL